MELSQAEARVVGCLIEKQLTTPQYYPLTLNALVAACNQTSNRDPVVHFDEGIVERALAGLREKQLTRIVHSVHNRAARYRHVLDEVLNLDTEDLALVGVLLLRGPQTVAELRQRTERMARIETTGEVEFRLDRMGRRDEPLAVRLERRPGQKEARYMHLLCGPIDEAALDAMAEERNAVRAVPSPVSGEELQSLRADVASLRDEVDALRKEVAELRDLFEG